MNPVARIRIDALRDNAQRAPLADAVLDLRWDAWGHGTASVAAALRPLGLHAVRADPDAGADLAELGIRVVDARAHADDLVDARQLYGLAGATTPVMRMSGTVLGTKVLRRGEGVSYGYRYRAPQDTRVALISGGYGQGVVRALGGAAHVSIEGRACPILGRVAMDVCVVDIGDAAVTRGETVWFFGDETEGHPSLREWSRVTGMDVAELTAAVGAHARRIIE
ncbi:alanine racemase C-terminal domain-containing protein [Microbacterium aurantiacum]|uniref:alanine racemase C-terminal domain-containing protein n=1 Tax=Microbacterium aurantiacum TaxID=162393 RepID=UPI003F498E2B